MKGPRKKAVIGAAIATAVVSIGLLIYHFKSVLFGIMILVALAAAALGFNLRQGVRTSYDYESSADIAGMHVRAALLQSHPTLGEYKRYIWINNSKRIFLGSDPGGHPEINVFNLKDTLVFQTFSPNILIIDKRTRRANFEARTPTDKETNAFAGKFQFVPRGGYIFVTKEEDPSFSPEMLKGG